MKIQLEMNFIDQLFESQIIRDKILKYLDAKSLANFGAVCKEWRTVSNNNLIWKQLCKLKSYQKFEYLVDTQNSLSLSFKNQIHSNNNNDLKYLF